MKTKDDNQNQYSDKKNIESGKKHKEKEESGDEDIEIRDHDPQLSLDVIEKELNDGAPLTEQVSDNEKVNLEVEHILDLEKQDKKKSKKDKKKKDKKEQ